MKYPLYINVDSRLHLPSGLPERLIEELSRAFRHANPDYHKRRGRGGYTGGVPRYINTSREEPNGGFSVPRGGTQRLREILGAHGYIPQFVDRRMHPPEVEWPELRGVTLRWYQEEALKVCLAKEQGLIRAPTGAGKTLLLFALARATRLPTLVIMDNQALLEQWREEAVERLGLKASEVGILSGSSRALRVGSRLTLGLRQTLASESFPMEQVTPLIGAVMVDEAHRAAADTFLNVLDVFPARYRFGATADETRRDKKEFLLYDMFGSVLYSIERETLEEDTVVLPVTVRLVPTEFRADWYRQAPPGPERDFNLLLQQMAANEEREARLLSTIQRIVAEGEVPIFVFSQRKEHASRLADEALFHAGIPAGLMMGGATHKVRFNEDKARLNAGKIPVAVGTYHMLGTGMNVPRVRAGVMALPLGANKQLFNQVRGRICRAFTDEAGNKKESATLYVVWDRHVFPNMANQYAMWNKGNTQILRGDGSWEEL